MVQEIPREDEIDLRPYISALLKRKWLILIMGASFAIAGLIFSLLSTKTYTALVTLLFTRNRATLSLAQEFPTVNEPVDFRSRMDAMLEIANSDALAQRTIQVMGEQLPATLRNIDTLSQAVNASATGDSLLVEATVQEPDTAAAIANTWAQELVKTINIAYSGEQPLSDIQEKLISAQGDYETAQTALEDFIRKNPQASLDQQIKEAQKLLDLVGNDRSTQLAYYYFRKQAMEQLLAHAQGLKKQVQGGSRSNAGEKGDALAVLWARMNALNLSQQLIQIIEQSESADNKSQPITEIGQSASPLNLQLVVPDGLSDTSSNNGADIDALIKLADEERVVADENIHQLTEEILNPGSQSETQLSSAASRVQELSQQLENTRANEELLKSNRDLAWKAYQALLEKETEIKNSALTTNQVFITGPAIPPVNPDSHMTLFNTAIAGVIGLFIGIVIAIALEMWSPTGS